MNVKQRLRKLIDAPDILVMPGVFDGYSIRLVERAKYSAAFVTGGGLTEAGLGWADYGIMSFEENLRVVRTIVGCSSIPLLADADTGYGNAVNVHFTVRGFERAGVAGIMLEDQAWPKRCGQFKGKELISSEEAAEKIHAATQARMDPDFVIMARTDSLTTHGVDEVIRRLNMFVEAGADLLFADALLSAEEIALVRRSVTKPLVVNMVFGLHKRAENPPLISAKELQGLGVAAVMYSRLLTSSAVRGMMNALDALGESLSTGKVVERPELQINFKELNELMGLAEIQALERSFLTREQLEKKYSAV